MKNFAKEKLEILGIHQLREVARDVGVRSPTTLKKEELIEKILLISTGKQERFVPKNNKGRPAKPVIGLDDFITTFFPQENSKNNFFNNQASVSAPEEDVNEFLKDAKDVAEHYQGFVDLTSQGIWLVRKTITQKDEDAVFISSILVEKHKLKIGDFIDCNIQSLKNGKLIVNSINKMASSEISERKNFVLETGIYPNRAMNFKGNNVIGTLAPIGFGQRALVLGQTNFLVKKFVQNLFSQAPGEKLLIIFDAQPEEEAKFEGDSNIVLIGQGSEDEKMRALSLAISCLHRKAEMGKNTTLFVSAGRSFLDIINWLEKRNDSYQKEICANFKNTANCGNCGLIFGVCDDLGYLIKQVKEKCFNLFIPLCERLSLYGVKNFVDVRELELYRDDNLLTNSGFKQLCEIKKNQDLSDEELANIIKTFEV